MKKYLALLALVTFTISIPVNTYALMGAPAKEAVAPMSTEDDGYRAESDPLPEWLFLPDGVDENTLTFSGTQSGTQTIKQSGTDRWEIQTERNGSKITYTYYEGGLMQFVIKTNKNYASMKFYTKNSKGKLKLNKSFSPDDYFDDNTTISLNTTQENHSKFSLLAHAGAANSRCDNHVTTNCQAPNKKRVKSKLSMRQLNKLNHKVGFKGRDASIANKVAYYESGGYQYGGAQTQIVACEDGSHSGFNTPFRGLKGVRACKKNGAGAGRGLYQISTQHIKKCSNKCAFSPEKNARFVYKMRKNGGWSQWCSYGGGCDGRYAAGQGPAMKH